MEQILFYLLADNALEQYFHASHSSWHFSSFIKGKLKL